MRQPVLADLGLALLSATAFWLLHSVAIGLGWAATVSAVTLLAGAVLALVVGRRRISALSPGRSWPRLLILAGSVAIQSAGWVVAIQLLGISLAAVLVITAPLFSTLLGQVLGRARITGVGALGLGLGFLGLSLIVLFPGREISWALIAGLLAGLAGSVLGAFTHRYTEATSLDLPALMAVTLPIAGLLIWPFTGLVAGEGTAGLGSGLVVAVLSVLLAGAIGLVPRWPGGQEGTRRAVPVLSVAVVVTIGTGIVGLRESLSLGQLLGAILLICGCALVLGRVPRWIPPDWRR